MDNLKEYRKKRNFDLSEEPAGASLGRQVQNKSPPAGGSFVIHKHEASRLHYDLRIEIDGVLKSWAVPKGPSTEPGVRRLAVQVEDHPIEYGDFEGTIPAGEYGGGTIMLWDRGAWSPFSEEGHIDDGRIDFILHGQKLQGAWSLVRTQAQPGEKRQPNWLLIKRRDKGSQACKINELSVATGRSMDEITKGAPAHLSEPVSARLLQPLDEITPSPLPKAPRPTLATLEQAPPQGTDWLHEIKFDGYRLLAHRDNDMVQMLTRNGHDWSRKFPALCALIKGLPCESVILDGEVVAFDTDGSTSFHKLQDAISRQRTKHLIYQVFDILYLDGSSLSNIPLIQRKAILRGLLQAAQQMSENQLIRYTDHMVGRGAEFSQQACQLGLEGIISKRADSSYRAGRSKNWLKIKCSGRDEFIICGYTDAKGNRSGFGALLLAAWQNDELIYAGKVGTGFNQRTLDQLSEQLQAMEIEDSSLVSPPQFTDVHWVKPELIAAIEFTDWTREGRLRHPVFLGLREDRDAHEVQLSVQSRLKASPKPAVQNMPSLQKVKPTSSKDAKAGHKVAGVALSNPQRIFYPEQNISKLQLAEYYAEIAEWILPHIRLRPLSLVRCPGGYKEECFFQKHPGTTVSDVVPRIMVDSKQGPSPYVYVEKIEHIIHLVQVGVLELHTWGSTIDHIEYPDTLVFDLDPAPQVSLAETYQIAFKVRDRLHEIGLHSFPRTTGGKGLHLVVPIQPEYTWPNVKKFCRSIAQSIAQENPRQVTVSISKAKRTGRVFIDYLRNGRGATSIACFSTRARSGAPVAVPLRWDEVKPSLSPDQYHLGNLKRRLSSLKTDPWADYEDARRSLKALIHQKE